MSHAAFKKIALLSRVDKAHMRDTLCQLYDFLIEHQQQVVLEQHTAEFSGISQAPAHSIPGDQLGESCDLAIVVGGDGSLLHAARTLAPQNLPVLGINRGRLGFLTDIHPENFQEILPILAGQYQTEKRTLLRAEVWQDDTLCGSNDALNDIVLLSGNVARMISFDIFIDDEFLCSQRADGLIIASPTGSTAYALSAGGPILHPALNATVLVPMFAHTLTSRPIVIGGQHTIRLSLIEDDIASPGLSCDGQTRIPVNQNCDIHINQNRYDLTLIHPEHYNYFETLRSKLHWGHQLTDLA